MYVDINLQNVHMLSSFITLFQLKLLIFSFFRNWQICNSTLLAHNYNIARSELSSHTSCGSHQRLQHFQRKDKIVKDFKILNEVVSEKTLMKNVYMCYIGVTEGKTENLKKEGKMRIIILVFNYTIYFAS